MLYGMTRAEGTAPYNTRGVLGPLEKTGAGYIVIQAGHLLDPAQGHSGRVKSEYVVLTRAEAKRLAADLMKLVDGD